MSQAEAERDRWPSRDTSASVVPADVMQESATAVSLLRCFVFIQGRQNRGHRSIGGACLILGAVRAEACARLWIEASGSRIAQGGRERLSVDACWPSTASTLSYATSGGPEPQAAAPRTPPAGDRRRGRGLYPNSTSPPGYGRLIAPAVPGARIAGCICVRTVHSGSAIGTGGARGRCGRSLPDIIGGAEPGWSKGLINLVR